MINFLAPSLRIFFKTVDNIREIRLRVNNPIIYYTDRENIIAHILTKEQLEQTIELMSGFSLYAFESELKNGFLTIKGGHRVGIAGEAVTENGKIKTLKNFSSINIRINRQIIGCCKELLPHIMKGEEVLNTCIISPPGFGKTTILRDLIRNLSEKFTIGVVDERSELAACHLGIPQNDLGKRTDILDACPKSIGMEMLLRSMAPQIIAIDELGSGEEEQVKKILTAGIKLICTMHGSDMKEAKKLGLERYILLGKDFKIRNIE
ncbi:MAG: stage III sporulation protein AA [Defluviitaleaceae bacterium]|nr:stage III sporulation protein AA [Defluviitaleaceae bacterium]